MRRRRAPAAVQVADPVRGTGLVWNYGVICFFLGTESDSSFVAKCGSPLCQCPTARETAVLERLQISLGRHWTATIPYRFGTQWFSPASFLEAALVAWDEKVKSATITWRMQQGHVLCTRWQTKLSCVWTVAAVVKRTDFVEEQRASDVFICVATVCTVKNTDFDLWVE